MTAQEALSCIQHYPPILEITRSYADGLTPTTRNPYAELAEANKKIEQLETAAISPRIRPLVWSEVREPCESCRYHHVVAESAIGQFSVEWKGWKNHDSRDLYLDGKCLDAFDAIDEAKLHAEKHLFDIVMELIELPIAQLLPHVQTK